MTTGSSTSTPSARDASSGAEVLDDGRDAIVYRLGERSWRPFVERGVTTCVYVTDDPRWTDGTPLNPAELAAARDVVARVFAHWRVAVEFG